MSEFTTNLLVRGLVYMLRYHVWAKVECAQRPTSKAKNLHHQQREDGSVKDGKETLSSQ